MEAPPPLVVGLRFNRRDAKRLHALAERGKSEGLHSEHIALFSRAAEDAGRDEPLRVICSSIEEAQVFAGAFVLYGVPRPGVEAMPA